MEMQSKPENSENPKKKSMSTASKQVLIVRLTKPAKRASTYVPMMKIVQKSAEFDLTKQQKLSRLSHRQIVHGWWPHPECKHQTKKK